MHSWWRPECAGSLARYRGAVHLRFLIDTHGDADLGNDTFVEDLGFDLVGQFPSFDRKFDLCAVIDEAVAG